MTSTISTGIQNDTYWCTIEIESNVFDRSIKHDIERDENFKTNYWKGVVEAGLKKGWIRKITK